MSELERLLAQYGQGYQPDLGGDDLVTSTRDVMARYREPNLMDRLADMLPANREHGLSAFNMAKGAATSSGNWLGQTPQVGPDTLAPLGAAGVGAAAARHLSAAAALHGWPEVGGAGITLTHPGSILMAPHFADIRAIADHLRRTELREAGKRPMPDNGGITLYANGEGSKVPGTVVNAVEQSSKPTVPPAVRLYRGESKNVNPSVEPERQGQWWTRSKDRAHGFAGPDGNVYFVDVPFERMGDLKSKASGTNYILPPGLRAMRRPATELDAVTGLPLPAQEQQPATLEEMLRRYAVP